MRSTGWRVAALAIALAGCKHRTEQAATCDPQAGLQSCGQDPDGFACRWGRLVRDGDDLDGLRPFIAGEPDGLDSALRRFFPAIGNKALVDGLIPEPEGLVFRHAKFEPYPVTTPIDWRADPYHSLTWQIAFQNLSWLDEYIHGDSAGRNLGAAIVSDWVDQALPARPALTSSWELGVMAVRLGRTEKLVDAYIANEPVLDRRFLAAAAQLILSHLYGIAKDECYVVQHNHSMWADTAALHYLKRHPAIVDGERLWRHIDRRLIEEQVRRGVTEDGIEVENSPAYQLFFMHLVQDAIAAYRAGGVTPPAALVHARDRMLEPLVRMVQPDLTFAQFGDTDDSNLSKQLGKVLEDARSVAVGDPSLLRPLVWVASGGASGSPPADTDRVYAVGGYAFFRDRWDIGPESTSISAQFRCSRLSGVHYHGDETGIEIFAHGRPLIVGPGFYTHDKKHPFWAYARSQAGNNVLVVDQGNLVDFKQHPMARIIDHGADGDAVWVQGIHDNYFRLGVSRMIRTFVYAKPDTFVIVDHVAAAGTHTYDQHFHVHPDVTELRAAGDRTMLAGIPGGPSLSITAGSRPADILTARGVQEGAVRQGWYFPAFQVAVPAYDILLRHRRDAGDFALPVLIVISPPGKPPRVPTDLAYADDGVQVVVSWRMDGQARSVRFPRPLFKRRRP